MAEAANLDPPLPQEKSKACTKCGKYCLRIKRSGTKGFCDKCMKLHHEETMANRRYNHQREIAAQKLQHDREEAESRRQQEKEEATRRRNYDTEEAKRRRQQEREEALRRWQHEKEEALRRWQHEKEENELKRKHKLEEDKIKAEMEKHKREMELKQIQEQCKRDRDEIKLQKLTECRLLFEKVQICDEEKVSMLKQILELDDKKEIKQPTNHVQRRSVKVEEIVQEGPCRGRWTRQSSGLRRNN